MIQLHGMPVITSLWMTEPRQMKVAEPAGRTGWIKLVMRVVEVPRRDAFVVNGRVLVHPAMLPEIRSLLAKDALTPSESRSTSDTGKEP